MKIKKSILMLLIGLGVAGLSACQSTDVVGKVAVTSYNAVIDISADNVSLDESKNHWVLNSPNNEKFSWSKDFSSKNPDAQFEFDAVPFINAGLDVNKLSKEKYVYDEKNQKILIPFEIGDKKFNYNGEETSKSSFEQIVKNYRDKIGYHEKLDHYGIDLGDGNKFEWAKDMDKNDKDIVFILEPKPFIDAGVDPTKVEGWAFAGVEEKKGEKPVDKFLKPFDLK